MKKAPVEQRSWFDHPEWFEIGFQDVTVKEADFFELAFQKYCDFPVRRLLEPACGSGRLVVELASRGYQVTGFDLSKPSVNFLRERLKKRKLPATAMLADMTKFKLPGRFDSAYCTYNSFRVLPTEEAARSHLQCVADAVRPGGLYFLGFHLAPPGCDPYCTERWIGRRGRTHITTTLRVIASSQKTRLERLRISVLVRELARETGGNGRASTNGSAANGRAHSNGSAAQTAARKGTIAALGPVKAEYRLRDEFNYRMYTAAQVRSLLASVPQFELLDVFDFWYEIDEPQKLDNDLIDALFVLRRK